MPRLARVACLVLPLLAPVRADNTSFINFPANLIPFASVNYVTSANAAGDHLVVGVLTGGPNGLNAINANVPLPSVMNQAFCDAQVQLVLQQYYPNVYVPTAAERAGAFSAFTGLLVNPANNQPFPNGTIPAGLLGSVYAWRIGTAQVAQAAKEWSPTGSMATARGNHAAVLLPNAKVLVAGTSPIAELYDPTTGAFSSAGPMRFPHGVYLTATLLNDGRVLIVGGSSAPSSAELYDPASGQFAATGGTVTPHGIGHTATLLSDGRVLIAGGAASGHSSAPAELYDPRAGSFTATGSMAVDRFEHTATLLGDGRVLVAGGAQGDVTTLPAAALSSAEIFDPSTGKFSLTGAMNVARNQHFAALLSNGKVLIGGGFPNASAELFDPSSGTFAFTDSKGLPNANSTATLLSSGQVLVAGGNGTAATNAAELYNAATGAFAPTSSMTTARFGHQATMLFDGRVLVTGGFGTGSPPPAYASAELYTPVAESLIASQSGLTFRSAQGGAAPPQTIVVLSLTDTIPWTLSAHTYSGGNWLKATPTQGTSSPAAAPVTLSIAADATGLAAQDYYGVVTITPTDGRHPPVSIAIVLSIVPAGTKVAPSVSPTGLVFLAAPGATAKPQSFAVSNLTSSATGFTATGSASPNWFDFGAKSGSIAAGQTTSITVIPSIANLNTGVYSGSIQLSFSGSGTQTVNLLLIVSPIAGGASGELQSVAPRAVGCTPSKLLPVFTTLGTGFSTPVAWPAPIVVQVVDDCGTAANAGSVTLSFSNGDSPLSLLAVGNGAWTGTWVPTHTTATAAFAVRADAQSQQPALSGSVQVTGQVLTNPNVPIVNAGGVVSSGDYTSSPALGLLVSIFGSALADAPGTGAGNLPLPLQIGSTSVIVSGTQLPVLYANGLQVNALIPYDLAINSPHQLIVQRGNAISVPVKIAIFNAQPAILATEGNGTGQGHIYKVDAQGNAVLGDANSPASAGDVLVMYAVGLGPVTPPVKGGDPAPVAPSSSTVAKVTVTIGGLPSEVQFAGLTPGFAGLYQVNAVTPGGVTPGSQVPVVVSVGGTSSSGVIYMAVK
jgi:uncharacterized protein (TIGR03437 family)